MTLSSEDRMAQLLLPAVRSTRPSRVMQQVKDVERAITPGGYISPGALPPVVGNPQDWIVSSATASSSDTVNYASYISDTLVLPAGLWRVTFFGGLSGRLSTSSNLNSQITADVNTSSNFQIPLASGDMGTVWQNIVLDQAPGGSELAWSLNFRPSAGTATIEAGFLQYRMERIG